MLERAIDIASTELESAYLKGLKVKNQVNIRNNALEDGCISLNKDFIENHGFQTLSFAFKKKMLKKPKVLININGFDAAFDAGKYGPDANKNNVRLSANEISPNDVHDTHFDFTIKMTKLDPGKTWINFNQIDLCYLAYIPN